MNDTQNAIVAAAEWGIANHAHFAYSEAGNRMDFLKHPRFTLPVTTDCSGAVTMWFWLAGANDPNKLGFDGEGYTGTLLSAEDHIAQWIKNAKGVQVDELIPADLVVYGGGTGEHVALIVEIHGPDILTISMGQNGDPSYVWVNAPKTVPSRGYGFDGRQPQTFLRCSTNTTGPVHLPPAK